jgi:peptide/nickel transport system permease protein
MIILWTDGLIFALIIIAILSIYSLLHQPQWQRPLLQIIHSVSGMTSFLMLSFFIIISVLDSIHFRSNLHQQSEIISVLDYLLNPLRLHSEKTYSAPFAIELYSKEWVNIQGKSAWVYPRLQYGGAHLFTPENHLIDIVKRIVIGLLEGMILYAAILGMIYKIMQLSHCFPWWLQRPLLPSIRSCIMVAGLLMISITILIQLASVYHVLGTDKVGEDVLYQAIKSIRTGLVIGSLTTLIMLPFAILFGILAGYFQGWVDDIIQYIYTTLNAIPSVLLIAASVLMVQVYMANHPLAFTNPLIRADMRLLCLCFILGMTSWTGLCRLLRNMYKRLIL